MVIWECGAFESAHRPANFKNLVILSGATLKAGRSRRTFAPICVLYQFQVRRSFDSRGLLLGCPRQPGIYIRLRYARSGRQVLLIFGKQYADFTSVLPCCSVIQLCLSPQHCLTGEGLNCLAAIIIRFLRMTGLSGSVSPYGCVDWKFGGQLYIANCPLFQRGADVALVAGRGGTGVNTGYESQQGI